VAGAVELRCVYEVYAEFEAVAENFDALLVPGVVGTLVATDSPGAEAYRVTLSEPITFKSLKTPTLSPCKIEAFNPFKVWV